MKKHDNNYILIYLFPLVERETWRAWWGRSVRALKINSSRKLIQPLVQLNLSAGEIPVPENLLPVADLSSQMSVKTAARLSNYILPCSLANVYHKPRSGIETAMI